MVTSWLHVSPPLPRPFMRGSYCSIMFCTCAVWHGNWNPPHLCRWTCWNGMMACPHFQLTCTHGFFNQRCTIGAWEGRGIYPKMIIMEVGAEAISIWCSHKLGIDYVTGIGNCTYSQCWHSLLWLASTEWLNFDTSAKLWPLNCLSL